MTFPRSDKWRLNSECPELTIRGARLRQLGLGPSGEPDPARSVYDSCSFDDPTADGWTVEFGGWFFSNFVLRTHSEVINFCLFASRMYVQGQRDKTREFRELLGIKHDS